MSYDPKTQAHHCDCCGRMMNTGADLTGLSRPGGGSKRICAAGGCWRQANDDGFMTSYQARGEQALADGSYYSPPGSDRS